MQRLPSYLVPVVHFIMVGTCCVVVYGYENGHQKDTCCKEVGIHAQSLLSLSRKATTTRIIGPRRHQL